MALVRAVTTFHGPDGLTVNTGDELESTNPIVRSRPELFERADSGVESATAAPGEKRSAVKRPAKKADA